MFSNSFSSHDGGNLGVTLTAGGLSEKKIILASVCSGKVMVLLVQNLDSSSYIFYQSARAFIVSSNFVILLHTEKY